MDIKVVGEENLVRDGSTGAILNVDQKEYLVYKKRKIDALRIRDKENEFLSLKNEVKDLKAMLIEIYEKVINNK